MTDIINTNEGADDMSNRIPVAKKESIIKIPEAKAMLDAIFFLGNGALCTKQLFEYLEYTGQGTKVSNQKILKELLMNEILDKRQILDTKNNMVYFTCFTTGKFLGISSQDAQVMNLTSKGIMNNIITMECILNNLPTMQEYFQKTNVVPEEIRYYLRISNSTLCMTAKDSLSYYDILLENFTDDGIWTLSFYDDISILKVQTANKKNLISKYVNVKVDEKDQQVYDDYMYVKDNVNLSPEKFNQEYFNISNMLQSSASISYIVPEVEYLEVGLSIFDNANLTPSRIAEIASHTYLMLKKYMNLPGRYEIKLKVYVLCNDEETKKAVEKACTLRADVDEAYGLRGCTKIIGQLYNYGTRYPDSSDNIEFVYVTSGVDRLGIHN